MLPHYTGGRDETVGRKSSPRGAGKRWVEGKAFRLADEVRYIQNKAAEHGGRVVSLGPLVLFSTATGDAWRLDVTDQRAAPLARDGGPEPIPLEQTDTCFAIGWKGHSRIDGLAFVYLDRDWGRIRTILGYPTQTIAQAG